MQKLAVIAILLTLTGLDCVRAKAQDKALLVGFSTATCDQLNQLLTLDAVNGQQIAISWLDGFLSGMNLLANQVKKETSIDLATTAFPDAEVRLQWVKSSCAENPKPPLWAHAYKLYGLLVTTQ